MKNETKNCNNSSYYNLLKNLCNILKERSNKESSYATFYQSETVVVILNDFFPFNITEPENEDIFLLDPTTIQVIKSGVYHIIYKIPVQIDDKKDSTNQSLGLYINGVLQKNIQRIFAIKDPCNKNRMFILEDIVVYVPNNSTFQLKNDNFTSSINSITTYNGEDIYPTFNIVKIG